MNERNIDIPVCTAQITDKSVCVTVGVRYKFNVNFALCLHLILLLVLISGCNTTKYLGENETLLGENIIEFDEELKPERRRRLTYELSTVNQQKPNTKFMGLFRTRLWMYFNSQRGKQTKFKKWVQRSVAEPPAVFNEKKAEKTAESMQFYLNNKGYFNAVVNVSNNLENTGKSPKKKPQKIVDVTYSVATSKMYRVDSTSFDIQQNDLYELVDSTYDKTLLKKGAPIDNKLFDREKNRITRILRNSGYAFFYPNYIKYLSYDSLNYQVDVTTRILPPTDSTQHKAYTIDDIYVFPDYYPGNTEIPSYDTLEVGGCKFVINDEMGLRKKPILDAIFLKKNQSFTQIDYDDTARKLDDLGIYKFISVQLAKPKPGNKVDAYILLTPRKKMEFGYDVEANTNNGGMMGTALSLSYRNRNLLRGAEVFRINSNFGLDFLLQKNNPMQKRITGIDIGLQAELYLPKFLVPFRLRDITRRNDPRTRLALNYNYFDRIQFFKSQLFTFSFGYEWNETFTKKHRINPININYFQLGEVRDAFKSILMNNTYLENSFNDQLFPGISYDYTYTGTKNQGGSSWFFQGNVETAGNLTGLIDKWIQPNKVFRLGDISYSQFARFQLDTRFYQDITRSNSIAMRLMGGVALNYGNSETVPYVKQFFAGGVSDIRAWRIRNLGPGAYQDNVTTLIGQAYQSGDIQLEANFEYRFHIVSYLKGALFVDAGNVWLRENDAAREGGQFTNDFYKSIAVGAGIGFRFDYSYFVIRLDMAYKFRNPYPDEFGRYRFYPNGLHQISLDDTVYNLAIGYPF